MSPRGRPRRARSRSLQKGITAHGVPQRLLTDNGAALNPSRRGAVGQLVTYVEALGVEAITGKPYKPTTQGKNERFHQTLNRSCTPCMTPKLSEYVEAGYALSPDERLEAVRMLRLSVDQDTDSGQAEVEAAWDDVIERRVGEAVRGNATLMEGREAMAQICADLAARRR